ncbi:PAS domain S-box protein, partial [Pontiella sp.]|uniref:PAS domain-containing sensor histidine kinase n=1 Tax=Pontiella sp. TaxID=2837462 RepID=UPI0035620632
SYYPQLRQRVEELNQAKDYLDAIFNATVDAIFIHDAETGVIVDVNRGAERMYRMTRGQMIGCAIEALSSGVSIYRKANADDWMRKAREEGHVDFEWQAKRADGTVFWVDASMTSTRIEGKELLIVVVRDIEMRKRAEMDLRRLTIAIEQSPDIVIITDTEGTIQYVNPSFERITGYAAQEVIGKNPRLLKSGEHDAAFYAELWNTLLAGKPWKGRLVNLRKDGSRYTEQAQISPVFDNEGTITNFVALKRDISLELQREEHDRQKQKLEAVGQLTSGIAHDFNNILQGILGFSSLLKIHLEEEAEEYGFAEEIRKSAKRGAQLIQQLLAFSREQPVQPVAFDLNAAINDSKPLLEMLLGDQHTLAFQPAPDLVPILADRGQTDQIVMNMAVNARDAMPDGGRLTIATELVVFNEADAACIPDARPGSYVCLTISDTGLGMSPETLERLFEPFFSTKEAGKGSGLGLSVVYGIVQQMKGWITVSSKPGEGSCFKTYFPVA